VVYESDAADSSGFSNEFDYFMTAFAIRVFTSPFPFWGNDDSTIFFITSSF